MHIYSFSLYPKCFTPVISLQIWIDADDKCTFERIFKSSETVNYHLGDQSEIKSVIDLLRNMAQLSNAVFICEGIDQAEEQNTLTISTYFYPYLHGRSKNCEVFICAADKKPCLSCMKSFKQSIDNSRRRKRKLEITPDQEYITPDLTLCV